MTTDNFNQIPEGCLILNNNPAFTNVLHDSFLLNTSALLSDSGLVELLNPKSINDTIQIMIAESFDDLNLPKDIFEKKFGTVLNLKLVIADEITSCLLCNICPLANKICKPDLNFDGISNTINIIPRPAENIYPDGDIDIESKQTGYFDLPLAS